ncbi:MAG: tyrosine-type recombinase/integrase [Pseudomonadota bacterium]
MDPEARDETLGETGKSAPTSSGRNDRTIYAWQNYAGKFSSKTSDRHLAAIRLFETTLKEKRFASLTRADVGAVRDKLLTKLDGEGEAQWSRSIVAHMASHIRDFLSWLLKQDGFQGLPQDFVDYMDLPRPALQKGIGRQQRPYPDLEEAEVLLKGMPKHTVLDLRARAMFALSFLAALRADTLTSLRIKHVDVNARTVLQDASVSRTKNGKSLVIKWFPIPPRFADEVVAWLAWLSDKGFCGEDALFPEASMLSANGPAVLNPGVEQLLKRGLAEPMSSKHAVEAAFRIACAGHDQTFSPHAARHTIKPEMDRRALTTEERKAWSQNMGHESLQTTETHYGHLSDKRRFEVLERPGDRDGMAFSSLAEMETLRDETLKLFERFDRFVRQTAQSGKPQVIGQASLVSLLSRR